MRWTVKERGEKDIPKFDIEQEEQKLRKIMDEFEGNEYSKQTSVSGK